MFLTQSQTQTLCILLIVTLGHSSTIATDTDTDTDTDTPTETYPLYTPPTFTYTELLKLSLQPSSHENTLLKLHLAVAQVGLFAVDSIPSIETVKAQAISSAAGCFEAQTLHNKNKNKNNDDDNDNEFRLQSTIGGGDVYRNTFGRIRPHPLLTGLTKEPHCVALQRRHELLSDAVHSVVHTIAALLSRSHNGSGGMKDMVRKARKVEHWHSYTTKRNGRREGKGSVAGKEEMTLEMHVDQGLLVAFTAALRRGEDGEFVEDDSFLLELNDGSVVTLDQSGAGSRVYIMFGGEASAALSAESVVPFRAAPHAVRMKSSDSESGSDSPRIWFGSMYLMRLPTKDNMTIPAMSTPIGCGHAYRTVELAKGGCEKGEEFCWLQCMKKPDCPNSEQVKCLRADRPFIKDGMCPDCTLQCEAPSTDENAFCNGAQLSMYMDGLAFTMKNPRRGCLVFLATPFVMDSYAKFLGGLLLAFIMSFLLEALPVLRRKHMKFVQRSKVASALILVGQVTLAYVVMLLAMSYSVYLLGSVVLGIVVGHVILHGPRDDSLVVEGSCHMPLASAEEAAYVALSEE